MADDAGLAELKIPREHLCKYIVDLTVEGDASFLKENLIHAHQTTIEITRGMTKIIKEQ
jgi:hypothetical protein